MEPKTLKIACGDTHVSFDHLVKVLKDNGYAVIPMYRLRQFHVRTAINEWELVEAKFPVEEYTRRHQAHMLAEDLIKERAVSNTASYDKYYYQKIIHGAVEVIMPNDPIKPVVLPGSVTYHAPSASPPHNPVPLAQSQFSL